MKSRPTKSSASRGRLPHFGAISLPLTRRITKISRISSIKFGQLILSKMVKIVATRCHILMLKCTKFDFGWGYAPDPTEEAHVQYSPRPPRERSGSLGRGKEGRGNGSRGQISCMVVSRPWQHWKSDKSDICIIACLLLNCLQL